ncbi:putative acyl-coenzyme A thioesterase 9, mitochondrial [Apostichopus japonicus]|uniref:Putative acyl-coenzyme A thioesterase 9, mitochondrial n=1 Tax=Stichopus japonicus TaxID=307972 RepID=A0A2G8KJV7_STIJA|nr:putative acyl-coenzyme A thioesterase 9, mitochondrial [Apostichopus japonicus]
MAARAFQYVSNYPVLHLSHKYFSSTATRLPTVYEIREKIKSIVSASQTWRPDVKRSVAGVDTPIVQSDLAQRTMQDSYSEAVIPLSDPLIREKYINQFSNLRIGRLLEDLDTMGVMISYKHNMPDPGQETSPLTIVTALVDRLDLHTKIVGVEHDLKLTGNVTWVGTSSIEVAMSVKMLKDGSEEEIVSTTFVNVARDSGNSRAGICHPLKATTPLEESIISEGEQKKLLRQQRTRDSLLKNAPTAEERELVHSIFVDTLDPGVSSFSVRRMPPNSVWMESTKLKNALLCFPQERNIHNKIFGGYLMRQATEIAYTNAVLFCRGRVFIRAIGNIQFKKPVEIGSVIFYSSEVAFTEDKFLQIRVHTEVEDVKSGKRDTTNVFHFTIESDSALPRVIPKSYGESMLYLAGRRQFLNFRSRNEDL